MLHLKIVRPMLPFKADVCQQSSNRYISAVYVTYIKLGFLQYAFLFSINRSKKSDSYVDFKFAVLYFINLLCLCCYAE
jgi:hypothetical protein